MSAQSQSTRLMPSPPEPIPEAPSAHAFVFACAGGQLLRRRGPLLVTVVHQDQVVFWQPID